MAEVENASQSIETLANSAIAAGCLQAVMSMIHPELVKFVSLQRERVARVNAEMVHYSSFSDPKETTGEGNLSFEQQNDLSCQLKFLRQHWHSHLRYCGLDPELPATVQQALMYRNKVSHQNQMTLSQYKSAIATFEKLADMIECNTLVRHQIRELVEKLMSISLADKPQRENDEKHVENNEQEASNDEKMVDFASIPIASLDQILQHNYLYDEDGDPLWLELKLLGDEFLQEKNYSEAIEAYSQGLEVAPTQAELFGNRAKCYLLLKDFEKARDDAEEALLHDQKGTTESYQLLSEVTLEMGEYEKAKTFCDAGLKRNSNDEVLASRKMMLDSILAIEKEESAAEKNKLKRKERQPGEIVARRIKYDHVPVHLIETHARGSKSFEVYQKGIKSLLVAAEALLQVIDRIGTPTRSSLSKEELVTKGITNLRRAGEAGVAEAWFRLGVLYSPKVRKGIPLTPDPAEMLACFHKAAKLRPYIQLPGERVYPHPGVAAAENELGVCYRDGSPQSLVNVDLKTAFDYFLRAAEHDFPLGQYHVALAYFKGSGTPVNAAAARTWAARAAEQGLPEAQHFLAQLYANGSGGKRDEKQAQKWASRASQNQLTDLLITPDAATPSTRRSILQRRTDVFEEFYSVYLDQDTGNGVKREEASGSSNLGHSGLSPQTEAAIHALAQAGDITAWKYLESEKRCAKAQKLLLAGDSESALRELMKADLLWERPKGVFRSSNACSVLSKVLKEASARFEKNARDRNAAYVLGRWGKQRNNDVLEHWQRCVKMQPTEASFYFYLGTAYLTLERYEDALKAMEAAVAMEKHPDWHYWLAAPMIGLGRLEHAMALYLEYVNTNPPNERYIPDALYSIGALYLKKNYQDMAALFYGLGQMAESKAIRFPALPCSVSNDTSKKLLSSGMKKNGSMETIASFMEQQQVDCGFCHATLQSTQLLAHKLAECPRRYVRCRDCHERIVFDGLRAHKILTRC